MKLSKYVNFLKREDGYIMYHSQLGGACIIDDDIYKVIHKEFGDDFSDNEQEAEVQHFFYDRNFIVDVEKDHIKKETEINIARSESGALVKTIQLVVSNTCNFNCKYCFENDVYCSSERELSQKEKSNKVMTSEAAIKYLNQCISVGKKVGDRHYHVQFFGGEPLTNKETILSVLEHFKNGEDIDFELDYSIVTNGSLFDNRIAEAFSKYNVAVIVSFDNPKQTARETISGKNSMEEIYKGLNILKEHGVYTAFNSVLSSFTEGYFDTDIVDCALEYGVREIGIVLDLDPNYYTQKKVEQIVNIIMNIIDYAEDKGVLISGYWMSSYLALLDEKNIGKGFKTCSGTGCQLSIEPNGMVFSCKGSSHFYGSIDNLEKLFSGHNYKEYLSRSLRNSSKCQGCSVEGFCSGFCLGPMEKNYNSVNELVPNYCMLIKKLINELLIKENNLVRYEY